MNSSTQARRIDRLAAAFFLVLLLLSSPAALLAQNGEFDTTLSQLKAAEQRVESLLKAMVTQPEEHRDALVQQQQMLRNRYLQLLIQHLQVLEILSEQPAFAEAIGSGPQELHESTLPESVAMSSASMPLPVLKSMVPAIP